MVERRVSLPKLFRKVLGKKSEPIAEDQELIYTSTGGIMNSNFDLTHINNKHDKMYHSIDSKLENLERCKDLYESNMNSTPTLDLTRNKRRSISINNRRFSFSLNRKSMEVNPMLMISNNFSRNSLESTTTTSKSTKSSLKRLAIAFDDMINDESKFIDTTIKLTLTPELAKDEFTTLKNPPFTVNLQPNFKLV